MTDLYPTETFTDDERRTLAPHVTNLHSPVFALTNLPETTKGMLFARYSRYAGTLRRLMLDEFSDSLTGASGHDGEGGHAAQVADRVIGQFGDDSVMQLAGIHVACEWSSNLLTKILQRPRIGAAYLEQSTRYIAFNQPVEGTGRYRYYRHPDLGPGYETDMDFLFETYGRLVEAMTAYNEERFPRADGESEVAWRRALRAKALDACRGLLPAASLSHMGIYASGQAYEQLILHLLGHPLPEARDYGQRLLTELKAVIPSFLTRVERPDRGGAWTAYIVDRRVKNLAAAERLGLTGARSAGAGSSVRLIDHHGTEEQLLSALIFEEHSCSEAAASQAVQALSGPERRKLLAELMDGRANRRHRPGRGMERLSYRFEIVSDYGAFRDLQRHRMLTCQWQQLTPDLGADIPEDITAAGLASDYRVALNSSASRYEQLLADAGREAASYALCLAYRLRYTLDLNAREAMQMIELRSGREGHPSYRAVALEMYRQIAEVHPTVAAAMAHVDHSTDARLERLSAELRSEAKQRTNQDL